MNAQLPKSLIDIAEALDISIALDLMRHFGGMQFRFPVVPKPEHRLAKALGKDRALALCHFMSGQILYVPHGRPAKSARRDVIALRSQGRNHQEIARLLGLSDRHVRRVANTTENPNQLNLFGSDRT